MSKERREKRLAAAKREILAICELNGVELETEYDDTGLILLAASDESGTTMHTSFLRLNDQ